MIDFKDKKILVTGATGGIGHALVKKICIFKCKCFSHRYKNRKTGLFKE